MNFSRLILSALVFGPPRVIAAQPQPLAFSPSARVCAAAVRSMREWGWTDAPEASSLAAIVSAVNEQLRSTDGRLAPADIARLEGGAASTDPCVRELSLGILKTQTRKAERQLLDRRADAGKASELRNSFVSARVQKSVTRSAEKQSPTREAISP
jgi:hypothetical protein